jgi:hypothetical protein
MRGDCPVLEFMETLDEKTETKFLAFVKLLGEKGPNLLRPYADTIRGPIRELRVQSGRRNVRVLYFFMHRDRIVLVHSFLKKSDAVEERDIRLAETRMVDWINRSGGK